MNGLPTELLALKRQLAWDIVAHQDLAAPDVQTRLGLNPASYDVLEMEHADSHARAVRVAAVTGRVLQIGALAAPLVHSRILELLDESEEEQAVGISAVLAAVVYAAVADLVDKDVLSMREENHG